jgi:hypothetical protein
MIYTIKFKELSAMLLDFVDHTDGFLYLRMVGPETAVNAIWAQLSARDTRGQKWGSEVSIPSPGRSYPQYVTAQKNINYRTLRRRLPSGMVDLALVHPRLTVAEDTTHSFYLLTYDQELPAGFFERLNQCLSIPLKPEWDGWLWTEGQQTQTFWTLETRKEYDQGQYVDRTRLTETTKLPIKRLDGLGQVACYQIHCEAQYQQAWLQIIREQLQLGVEMTPIPSANGQQRYQNGSWSAHQEQDQWILQREHQPVAAAPSLNHLLTDAREKLGVHFLIQSAEVP